MTFQKKLTFLVVCSFSITLFISWISFKESALLKSALGQATAVDLPSVRAVTIVDMLHDGLKSLVYQAIYANTNQDTNILAAVKKDLQDWEGHFSEEFEKLKSLSLSDEIKGQVESSFKAMKEYHQAGAAVIQQSQGPRRADWAPALKSFEEQFSNLEGELEKLGEKIEASSGAGSEKAQVETHFYGTLQWLGNILGLCLMLLSSILIGRSMILILKSSVGDLNQGSEVLSSLSQRMTESSHNLSASVDEQSSAVQKTAASMDEISAMIRKTSEHSEQLVNVSKDNEAVSELGRRAAAGMLESIDSLSISYQNVTRHISETNQKIGEIQGVINSIDAKTKVINDIVFQTKILAFNASVEAARAGENGKGFAVVAEEVGNLAQMSGVASKEITSILESAANSVKQIVDQSKVKAQEITVEANRRLEESSKAAHECESSLGKINQNAEKIATYTEEMRQAISEQAKGIDEINSAITVFSQSSQSSSRVAKTGLSATSEISEEVGKLVRLAGGLRNLVEVQTKKAA